MQWLLLRRIPTGPLGQYRRPLRFKNGLPCSSRIPEELTSGDSCETSTDPFQHRMTRLIFRHLLHRMETIAVAFDCQAAAGLPADPGLSIASKLSKC